MMSPVKPWWKDGTVYQIYPASFKDSNGDGLGDIAGITSKLNYLKDLGVDIIWVSPMYDSPQVDMGYDIRNYEEVYAPFGDVQDMQQLIDQAHILGMRIILDLVINHTSDQHKWFQESRSSKNNAKRDWYIWKPARYDEYGQRLPPNNWRSFFSEPAWQWDEHTQEYYLHLFAKEQPDLNWDNEDTRNAIYNSAMRFWLDRGVDGFRIDTVNMYSKCPLFGDAPVVDHHSFYQPAGMNVCNGPRMHEFLREMNKKVLSHYDTMTVGELPHTPDPAHVLRYTRASDPQLDMCFQFDICDLGMGLDHKFNFRPWALSDLKRILSKWQTFHNKTDGWTTAFIENHDNGRSVSRFASDSTPLSRSLSSKMLSIMMTTLTGTLFIYQGQEIGMVNAPETWTIEDYKDIESRNFYNFIAEKTSYDAAALAQAMSAIRILARDHARLPMQWSGSAPDAGFSSPKIQSKPWMRVHDLYPEINVESQQKDSSSVLSFWKDMLKLRKQNSDLFIHGEFRCYGDYEEGSSPALSASGSTSSFSNESNTATNGSEESDFAPDTHQRCEDKTFIYTKRSGSDLALVALNFSDDAQAFRIPDEVDREINDDEDDITDDTAIASGGDKLARWECVARNYPIGGGRIANLRPWEGRVYLLKGRRTGEESAAS